MTREALPAILGSVNEEQPMTETAEQRRQRLAAELAAEADRKEKERWANMEAYLAMQEKKNREG